MGRPARCQPACATGMAARGRRYHMPRWLSLLGACRRHMRGEMHGIDSKRNNRTSGLSQSSQQQEIDRACAPRGKSHSSLNAGQHWLRSRVFRPYLKELGESAGDFDRVRESLHQAFRPEDQFELMLVADMVQIRWRRLEIDRERAVAGQGKGLGALGEGVLANQCG